MLGDHHQITIWGKWSYHLGNKVVDVDALQSGNRVSLSDCEGITDFSSLWEVPELILDNLPNLRSYEKIGKKHHLLSLERIKDLKNFSFIKNVSDERQKLSWRRFIVKLQNRNILSCSTMFIILHNPQHE